MLLLRLLLQLLVQAMEMSCECLCAISPQISSQGSWFVTVHAQRQRRQRRLLRSLRGLDLRMLVRRVQRGERRSKPSSSRIKASVSFGIPDRDRARRGNCAEEEQGEQAARNTVVQQALHLHLQDFQPLFPQLYLLGWISRTLWLSRLLSPLPDCSFPRLWRL